MPGKRDNRQLDREIKQIVEHTSSNIPTEAEGNRLDEITVVASAILDQCSGDDLDAALSGEMKRRGRSDYSFRLDAMNNIHPDDLISALVRNGFASVHSPWQVG